MPLCIKSQKGMEVKSREVKGECRRNNSGDTTQKESGEALESNITMPLRCNSGSIGNLLSQFQQKYKGCIGGSTDIRRCASAPVVPILD